MIRRRQHLGFSWMGERIDRSDLLPHVAFGVRAHDATARTSFVPGRWTPRAAIVALFIAKPVHAVTNGP